MTLVLMPGLQDPLPALSVHYSPRYRRVVVRDEGPGGRAAAVYRARTPLGEVSITPEHKRFPDYPGVETGPEGYALAIRAPRKAVVELRLRSWQFDHVSIDGRRVPFAHPHPTAYTCRLTGGDHFVEIASVPTE